MKNSEAWLSGRIKKKYNLLENWQKQGFLVNYINDLIQKGKLLDISSLPAYVDNKLKTIIRTATRVDCNQRYESYADMLKTLFDQQKWANSWWIDNGTINAKCLKSKGRYRIITKKSDFIAEYSTNGTTWRKKFDGSEKEIIKKITEHNN